MYTRYMKTLKNRYHTMHGQVVLITLLVLSIATTVALSFIVRSNIDVNMTNQTEESAKAFSAAEAGVEDTLKSGMPTTQAQVLSDAGTKYETTVTNIGASTGVFAFPQKTPLGNVETLWLVAHADDGTLTETPTYTKGTMDICWSHETTTPAMEMTLFYKRSGSYYVAKSMIDLDNATVISYNFINVTDASVGCGLTNVYRRTVTFSTDFGVNPVSDTLLFMRIRPVYGATTITIDTGGMTLPLQGKIIASTGSTNSGVTRKIQVYQFYRSPSIMFDSVLYSQGDLIK